MTTKGISVVIPAWGELNMVSNSVLSAVRQWAAGDSKYPKYEVIIVDDWIEGRREDGTSPYDYFMSEEFKKLYDTERVSVRLHLNEEHKYQGESREIGFNLATYDYFVLLDCDDMLAPNCLHRYWEVIEKESKNKPVAVIHGNLYAFDKNMYVNIIPGTSIWVQSRCYNRRFIHQNEVHFPTGTNSRQGEDYPFIRKFDYALAHDRSWQAITFDPNKEPVFAYWFPNYNSLSRQDPHYGQHLAGWTMRSSLSILEYMEWYGKENGVYPEDDEQFKAEVLNMNVYAMYNLLDFLREVAMTDWEPKEEDWYALRDAVVGLRSKLRGDLWNEIIPSAVYETEFNVKNHSDVRYVESWLGDFRNFVETDWEPLKMDYAAMRDYCKTLHFDDALHEEHASYVESFMARHKTMKFKQMTPEEWQARQAEMQAQMQQAMPRA